MVVTTCPVQVEVSPHLVPAPITDNSLYYGDCLLHGAEVKMPLQFGTFKQAQRVKEKQGA